MDKIEKFLRKNVGVLEKNLNNKNADGDKYDPWFFICTH